MLSLSLLHSFSYLVRLAASSASSNYLSEFVRKASLLSYSQEKPLFTAELMSILNHALFNLQDFAHHYKL